MPVQIQCPHCRSLCQVSEQHFGALVNCGRCGQPFTVQAAPATAAAQPAAPVFDPAQIKEKLRGVFRSLMPFSKVEGVGVPAQQGNAPMSAAEDDVNVDFGPGVAALLETAPKPAPQAPAPAPPPAAWTPPRAAGVLRLDLGAATSTGMVRKRNEDSFLVQHLTWSNLDARHELALAVVADGMGGHEAGDKASHLAIQTIGSGLAPLLAGTLTGQVKDVTVPVLTQSIETALKGANQAVYQRARAEAGCKGMGATAVVVLVWDGQAVIGLIGDCRVYGCRAGKVNQLTKDQTLVEKMVRLGTLRPEEAANHPARNEVAQAVGRQLEVEPAFSQLKLVAGDWLIIACDGLHAHVDAPLLEKTLREAPPSGTLLAHQLVELANSRGGSDNCSVIALRCY